MANRKVKETDMTPTVNMVWDIFNQFMDKSNNDISLASRLTSISLESMLSATLSAEQKKNDNSLIELVAKMGSGLPS